MTFTQNRIIIDPPPFNAERLTLIERIMPSHPLPGSRATARTIGKRILEWNQGTVYITEDADPADIHCDLNTARYWHIFEIWRQKSGLSVYCRCARVAASNMGMVFAQNFRIIVSAGDAAAQSHMADDSASLLRNELPIDPKKFRPDSCSFVGPRGIEWTEIYWSLKQFAQDYIILHGCDDKEYKYTKPNGTETHRIENI